MLFLIQNYAISALDMYCYGIWELYKYKNGTNLNVFIIFI